MNPYKSTWSSVFSVHVPTLLKLNAMLLIFVNYVFKKGIENLIHKCWLKENHVYNVLIKTFMDRTLSIKCKYSITAIIHFEVTGTR